MELHEAFPWSSNQILSFGQVFVPSTLSEHMGLALDQWVSFVPSSQSTSRYGVKSCLCCGGGLRPGGPGRARAVVQFVICWYVKLRKAHNFIWCGVTFLIAEVYLLAASAKNAYYRTYVASDHPPSCPNPEEAVFGAGAAFIFLSRIIFDRYYMSHSEAGNYFPDPYGAESSVRMDNLQ
ncbi:hypothetical protein Dimus_032775 [Dionaea muscipula]